MNRKIGIGLKKLLVLFILLLFFSVPVMGYSWSIWHSLDKSQYCAGTHGEASITLQNTGTTKIHITRILITFDWMEGYLETPRAYTKDVDVYLDVGDKKVLGDVSFSIPSTVSAGYHSYKIGVGMEELVEGWFGSKWEDKGWVWASKTSSVNIIHVGSVSVSSTPSGASIYLDGTNKGTTPKTIADVPVGTHSILLTKAGYYDETATITVILNQVAYVSERLDAKTGTIAVSSDPSGAMIYLDGSYKGVTPLTISDVPEGVHTVKLTKSGYKDYWETVHVSAGSAKYVTPRLTKETGSIYVSSYPAGANVYLDDSYQGTTPITIYDIATGSHTIKLTKSGYKDYQKTVYVSAGSKESVSGNLRLIPTPTPTTSVPRIRSNVRNCWVVSGCLSV